MTVIHCRIATLWAILNQVEGSPFPDSIVANSCIVTETNLCHRLLPLLLFPRIYGYIHGGVTGLTALGIQKVN